MPHFAELARVHSSEQAELSLARSRSKSTTTGTKPTAIPENYHSSTETLAEREEGQVPGEVDLEGGNQINGNSKIQEEGISKPEEVDEFLVTLKGREHLNPHSWGVNYRWFLTMFAALLALNATFASSAPSNLIPSIIEHFNVSEEIGILLISIFVAGYVIGPLLWGPLSERYGRKKVYLIAFWPYFAFQIGCAVAPNIGSLLAFRFLGGAFAASPLTNSGGVIADLWGADKRGDALAWFSLAPFMGPAIAPIISGYFQLSGVHYTYIFWLLTGFAGVCVLAIHILLPETYVPYLLHQEAKRLRKETGDHRWHSALEDSTAKEGTKEVLERTVLKPFIMIIQEPMLLAITIYMSFIYGIIYLLFEAVPIIFIGQHGLNSGEAGLVFLTLPVGGIIAVMTYIYYYNPQYMQVHHSVAPKAVAPEFRLRPLLFAAPAFAFSLFWIGFTSYPSISIASPILGLTLLGGCVLLIFLGCFNYLIDTYLMNAASALSINTVVRSALGAGFPLFAVAMYHKLGVPGATGLLAGLAVVFVPIPFLLLKYGRKIRELSKNAIVREEI